MKKRAIDIFRVPLLIGAASLAALVIALTGDGWRDMLSWTGLALPVIAIGYGLTRRSA